MKKIIILHAGFLVVLIAVGAELQTLAKEQLALEANQSAATAWLDGLRQSAKIVYK